MTSCRNWASMRAIGDDQNSGFPHSFQSTTDRDGV